MILGTAGHIDHGKTALVRALTGVDTDRLPEEKRRGITIDLGFAPLQLDGVGQVGVVDVPGHEAFVRTMVAGATGVDVALIVIAADAGVMPQTREHLAILDLLGVTHGVVALTKCDLVDEDWLPLVEDDVASTLRSSPFASAPVLRVSSVTGAGLDELRAALSALFRALPERGVGDVFRLPIDRAFTVRGTGTVVTGTVWSGMLQKDQTVRLLPADRAVRVRGLQAHSAVVDAVRAGDRAAVALAGVELDDVQRGMVLVRDVGFKPSRILRGDVTLLESTQHTIGPRTWLRLHLGTQEVGARMVTREPLVPGITVGARIVLDSPVVARAGDHFVLRAASPAETVGGGVITDPHAPVRARPWATVNASPAALLSFVLDEAGPAGIVRNVLSVRIGAAPEELIAAIAANAPWEVGDRFVHARHRDALSTKVVEAVRGYHTAHPLEAGAPMQWLRSQVGVPDDIASAIMAELARAGTFDVGQGIIALAGFAPTLSASLLELREAVLGALAAAGTEPPSVEEIAASLKRSPEAVSDVARWLVREGALVPVEAGRYYSREAIQTLRARLEGGMREPKEYTPAELREMLSLTRKFLIPFLEYCDREGYTIRGTVGRRLTAPLERARVS